ncbi:MAG: hypothetical protein K8S13_19075 [Desulfobacula sp.]|uniref:hypothetical protein n=1 Tax=Desulfobacula sp. TaxID=2593537 RepID=UPI0025C02AE0|nr:hypothetical protein [Desulfobacula sp.]MCD4721940.1 hypothetical protein [Desulfobacula sp.]
MKKNLLNKIFLTAVISALLLIFSPGGFAQEAAKPDEGDGEAPDIEYEVNINQIAFIVKYDTDGNGKVDTKEFIGKHFKNMDKNGDGFIEPHEAPEGQTAY